MNDGTTTRNHLEPEQYELVALRARVRGGLDRRDFLKTLGTGLLVIAWSKTALAQSESGRRGSAGARPPRPTDLDAWLRIANDGTVIFFTGKAEVGQNIRTSLTQIVAEELPVPLASISMVMADTDLTPYDAGTFGSRTTPDMGTQLRRVAATAREAVLDMAAQRLKVDRGVLIFANGRVGQKGSGSTLGLDELVAGQRLHLDVSETVPVRKAAEWKVAGHSQAKVNGRQFVTGQHHYTSDLALAGMVFGKVLRPPSFGAKLRSVDVTAAKKMDEVMVVRDGDFVGVTAPTPFQATKALDAIQADWETKPQVGESELFTHLRETSGFNGIPETQSPLSLRRTYHVAYIAHAPLEPRAAVANWVDGKLTVWTGTQCPFGVRAELADAFGVPLEQARVIVPDTGSAYGGKHTGEAAIEAARLAKITGNPVKLVWTREEEFTWAYFRPSGVIDVDATLTPEGAISHWEFHNLNSGNAGIRAPYRIEQANTEFHHADSPLRQGSYRGLASTANHFARESHIDDLARLVKEEPLAFRLKNLNDPRAVAVLQAAAKAFDWKSKASSPERGYGLAVGTEKGSFVATCVEIAIDPASRSFRVTRVVQAFECGAVVNPAHLISQNQGSILQGLGGALFEAVHFSDGRISNPHFASYRVPRFSDTPEIDVVLVNRPDLPSVGAGETPIVTIAPAIGNAIFQATGVRIAHLPLGERVPAT